MKQVFIPCLACCKRLRERCSACQGTGRMALRHALTPDAARRLAAELLKAGGG